MQSMFRKGTRKITKRRNSYVLGRKAAPMRRKDVFSAFCYRHKRCIMRRMAGYLTGCQGELVCFVVVRVNPPVPMTLSP